jgi:hypothetical protein
MAALVGMAAVEAHAGTIIKLSLGDDSADPDIEFDGTTLSTALDSDGGTLGDQNTNAEFLDFLSGEPDITNGLGSFTLDDLDVDGPATTFGGFLVIQEFLGGTLSLYDTSNNLLLSGTLDASTLTGPLGPPATGALFTTSFGMVTGGSLEPLIDPDTLTLSITFTDINDGVGFTTSGGGTVLNAFEADASVIIAAEPIPEPVTALLALLAAAGIPALRLRRSAR